MEKCLICEKELQKIDSRHLQKHKISSPQYKILKIKTRPSSLCQGLVVSIIGSLIAAVIAVIFTTILLSEVAISIVPNERPIVNDIGKNILPIAITNIGDVRIADPELSFTYCLGMGDDNFYSKRLSIDFLEKGQTQTVEIPTDLTPTCDRTPRWEDRVFIEGENAYILKDNSKKTFCCYCKIVLKVKGGNIEEKTIEKSYNYYPKEFSRPAFDYEVEFKIVKNAPIFVENLEEVPQSAREISPIGLSLPNLKIMCEEGELTEEWCENSGYEKYFYC